jgi:hypothetical protein
VSAAAVTRSSCPGCPVPETFCAATINSPYHRLHLVPSGTRAACRRRCSPSPPPPAVYASAAASARSTCPGDPIPSTSYADAAAAAAAPVAAFALLNNKPPVRALPQPPLLLPPSLADRASATAAAARSSSPGYPALGTTYVDAAAAPVAASIPRPSRRQLLSTATLPGTSTSH